MNKNITLVLVETSCHDLAKFSIEQTLKTIPCKDVIIFSDKTIIEGANHIRIRSNISLYDYSEIILKQLWPHVETDHILITQWDGMAVNSEMWSDEYLKYDYIGAIWPWGQQNIHMGNGGFSLRSRKLIDACRNTEIKLGGISTQNEDIAICVEYRKLLQEKYKINYAPLDIARKFSIENEWLGNKSFGFHGAWNSPRFLSNSDMIYYLSKLPGRFWTDNSKVQALLTVLLEQGYRDIVHELLNSLLGDKRELI